MSHTNDLILSDLRENGITPSKSNDLYQEEVQSWLWFHLGELLIWNCDPNCHCHDSWVQKTSYSFEQYAKDIWAASKGSYRNIQVKNKVWLGTPIKFPDIVECECMDESGFADHVVEVKLIRIFLFNILFLIKFMMKY